MKYLKRFNESISNDIVSDVKDILLGISNDGFTCSCYKQKFPDQRHKDMMKDGLVIKIQREQFVTEDLMETMDKLFEYLKSNKFKKASFLDIDYIHYTLDDFLECLYKTTKSKYKSKLSNLDMVFYN